MTAIWAELRARCFALMIVCLATACFGQGVPTSGTKIQFQQAGSNVMLGVGYFKVNFTGAGCTATSANNTLTVNCTGGGGGSVSSVGLTTPSWLTVGGSPVTTSGTLAVTPTAAQTSHQVIGTCGAATTFAPCALVAGDIPTAIPIGNIGSAGLSASTGLSISATGAITQALTLDNSSTGIGSPTASATFTVPTGNQLTLAQGTAAASSSNLVISGTPFTGGSATTNFGVLCLCTAGASAPTTLSASGTMFEFNAPSGFAGNFIDFHVNGATGVASIAAGGAFLGASFRSSLFENSVSGSSTVYQGGIDTSVNGALGGVTLRAATNSNAGASATTGTNTVGGATLSGSPTNGPGSDTFIEPNLGTGTGTMGHTWIKRTNLGLASGTTAQTQITSYVPHIKAGSTTSATPTTIFSVASATNTVWGVEALVHVQLISSTPNVCGTTERFSITGTNNNGAFGTVNIVAGTTSTLCSAGTLTLGVSCTAANPSVCSVTPTWGTITSITSDTISVIVENGSISNDVTLN